MYILFVNKSVDFKTAQQKGLPNLPVEKLFNQNKSIIIDLPESDKVNLMDLIFFKLIEKRRSYL